MKTSHPPKQEFPSIASHPDGASPISKPHKTPTIKEFADAIGVSPTTVSRSLTRNGRISDETRQMVLQRMEELGYTPNLHAQRLVTGRAGTVALCIGNEVAPTSDLFLAGLIRGLQQALRECGYTLLLLGQADELNRWIDSRAVDGVIFVEESAEDVQLARSVVRPEVPCVIIGTSPLEPQLYLGSVFIDLAGGAVKVARALVEKGHRHIGYIGNSYSQSVLPVFWRELERLGAPPRDEWAVIVGNTSDEGERAMRQLLLLDTPPSAVFTRNDELAVGALRAARKLGIEVPHQLSVVGHDDLALARLLEPPLSTVRIDCDAVGRAVVNMFLDLLISPHTTMAPRAVPTKLVLRETTGPPELSDV